MSESRSTARLFFALALIVGGIMTGYVLGVLTASEKDAPPPETIYVEVTVPPAPTITPAPTATPCRCEVVPALETADDYFQRALDLWERGYYDIPLSDLTQVIELEPDNAEAHFYRGWVLHAGYRDDEGYTHADYAGALADYNTALELDPDHSRAHNNRGVLRINVGEPQAALADFQAALELDPEYYYASWNLMSVAFFLEEFETVVDECHRRDALGASLGSTLYCYAAARDIEDYEMVALAMSQRIESEEQFGALMPESLIERGRAYRELERYDEALDDFNRAIALYSENSGVQDKLYNTMLERARTYYAMGDVGEAFAEIATVIEQIPDSATPYRVRAELHEAEGHVEDAIADYRTYLRLAEDAPAADLLAVTETLAALEAEEE